jgi:hypothetical protein
VYGKVCHLINICDYFYNFIHSKQLIFLFVKGYHYDYNSGCLDESLLEKLRLWPSDNDILKTIKLSRHLACELAEYVVIQPTDLPVEINRLNVIIESDNDEISIPSKSNNENELDTLYWKTMMLMFPWQFNVLQIK